MNSVSLILASGSPRRRRLLELAGFGVSAVRPPDVEEIRGEGEAPLAYARRLGVEKACAVDGVNAWVLAADTIVHRGDQIYEKPRNHGDAVRMLGELAGGWHKVTTAWCLRWSGPGPSESGRRLIRGHRTSRVRFRRLTAVEIARYVATGEGTDKAGAYAVQGDGASLIERVVGSTTNVIGLPIDSLAAVLESLGLQRENV